MRSTYFLPGAVAVGPCALTLGMAWGAAGCGDAYVQPIGLAPDASVLEGGSSVDAIAADEVFPEASPPAVEDARSCRVDAPLRLPGTSVCTGDLARRFRFAACACATFKISGGLQTDSIGSTSDAGGGTTASIGANVQIESSGTLNVGGSIWSAGGSAAAMPAIALQGADPNGPGTIAHDLRSGGDIAITGNFLVGGDVLANGSLALEQDDAGVGALTIGGTLHLPEGGTVPPGVTTGGSVVYGPVQIDPPCDCTSLDIAALVSAAASDNDNAAAG